MGHSRTGRCRSYRELCVVIHTENCVLSFIQRTGRCHSYREQGVVVHAENRALSFIQRLGAVIHTENFVQRTGRCHSYRELGVVIHTENWALSFIQTTGHCHSNSSMVLHRHCGRHLFHIREVFEYGDDDCKDSDNLNNNSYSHDEGR